MLAFSVKPMKNELKNSWARISKVQRQWLKVWLSSSKGTQLPAGKTASTRGKIPNTWGQAAMADARVTEWSGSGMKVLLKIGISRSLSAWPATSHWEHKDQHWTLAADTHFNDRGMNWIMPNQSNIDPASTLIVYRLLKDSDTDRYIFTFRDLLEYIKLEVDNVGVHDIYSFDM